MLPHPPEQAAPAGDRRPVRAKQPKVPEPSAVASSSSDPSSAPRSDAPTKRAADEKSGEAKKSARPTEQLSEECQAVQQEAELAMMQK
eukprot:5566344-Prymnesium_polylepis.1